MSLSVCPSVSRVLLLFSGLVLVVFFCLVFMSGGVALYGHGHLCETLALLDDLAFLFLIHRTLKKRILYNYY
jgi:hypothetical protein